jgi:hypothetical protein
MRERLKRVVLKTTVPERVPGVRIPLPPPCTLDCRESLAYFVTNYAKDARFSGNLRLHRTVENGLTYQLSPQISSFSLDPLQAPFANVIGELSAITYRMAHRGFGKPNYYHYIHPPKMRSICRRWFKSCAASKRTNSSTVCGPRTSWTP